MAGEHRGLRRWSAGPAGRTTRAVVAAWVFVAASACGDAALDPPVDDSLADPPRLHVTHISLLPHIPPPDHVGAPPDAGWPDVGQDVRWQGHLYNSGDEAADDVGFHWSVDGMAIADGSVDLPPGETVVELPRTWTGSREEISLRVEAPPGVAPERDDALTVLSDGLSVTWWMEAPLAEAFEEELGLGPFQVWAGREVRAWNGTLDAYRSPEGPPEILDRLRLDVVEVLPTGSPRPKEVPTDLYWYWLTPSARPIPKSLFVENDMPLHEVLHQRGIGDLYSYWVLHGSPNGSEVLIREPDGGLAAGSERMPFLPPEQTGGRESYVFQSPYWRRLMGTRHQRPARVDPHTAYGLNMRAGLRTPWWIDEFGNSLRGWSWDSQDENDYKRYVPGSVRLHIVLDGEPAPAGVGVEAFFDHHVETYHNRHGPDPDVVAVTGQDGSAVVSLDGLMPPVGTEVDSDVIILRVTEADASRWGYAFLPVYELNMAYFHGDHDVTDLTVEVAPT